MNERLGIYEELQAMQAKLGPFAYVAPVIVDDDLPRESVDAGLMAILEDVAVRLAALEAKEKRKRVPRLDLPSDMPVSQVAVADILDVVAETYGISVRAILSEARPQKVCRPRFAAARLLTKRLHLSSPQVARCLKRLDHTSVLHMLKRAKGMLAHDPEWAALYRAAEHALDTKQ